MKCLYPHLAMVKCIIHFDLYTMCVYTHHQSGDWELLEELKCHRKEGPV